MSIELILTKQSLLNIVYKAVMNKSTNNKIQKMNYKKHNLLRTNHLKRNKLYEETCRAVKLALFPCCLVYLRKGSSKSIATRQYHRKLNRMTSFIRTPAVPSLYPTYPTQY